MKGARSKRYASYKYQVHTVTIAQNPTRAGYTRDHILPVSFGFKHGIPAALMGSPENIQYMELNENIQKGQRITPKGIALLRKWGEQLPYLLDLAEAEEIKASFMP